MERKNLIILFELVFWLFVLCTILLLAVYRVEAATTTNTINFTVDNNSLEIETPSTTFQTTCGQQLTKRFDITHSYDETINNYYYTNTTINNTIIEASTENCSVTYNFTYANNSTNSSDLMSKMEATRIACNQAKTTCFDLYSSNMSFTLNVTGENIAESVNKSNTELVEYFSTTVFPEKQQCDSWKASMDRCTQYELKNCQNDNNITAIELKNTKNWSGVAWGVAGFAVLGWVTMILLVFGKAMKGMPDVGPAELRGGKKKK